jgi:hypothetical protein
VNFPEEGLGEHHEGETCIGKQSAGPCIVGAVEAGTNLVKVICCTHAPFHIIVSEDVVAVRELCWVAVGLVRLSTLAAVNIGRRVKVDVVLALAGSVTQVVEAGSNVLSEAAD